MEEMISLFPVNPLPSKEVFRKSFLSLRTKEQGAPALEAMEFAAYAYKKKLTWQECDWVKDIMRYLVYDTTTMPKYVDGNEFLMYYFPTCLKIVLEYALRKFKEKDGNVDFFVVEVFWLIGRIFHTLSPVKQHFIDEIVTFFEEREGDTDYYRDELSQLRKKMQSPA